MESENKTENRKFVNLKRTKMKEKERNENINLWEFP